MSDNGAIQQVLRFYLERLQSAVTRSPLLDATVVGLGCGQKVDLSHLNQNTEDVP